MRKRTLLLVSLVVVLTIGWYLFRPERLYKAAGLPIYERAWQNVQVSGMETRDYLAFVISNSPQDDNLQIASSLAPSVRDFLSKLEA